MNDTTARTAPSKTTHLPGHTCPACGMPAPAMLAVLPSGRQALIEACAICGRQEATPLIARDAKSLLSGRDLSENAREPA